MSDVLLLYARGLATTLLLLTLSCGIGHALAVPVGIAVARRSLLARFYVYVVRGTPLIVQLFVVYFGLPQLPAVRDGPLWPLFASAFACAVITLAMNTSAYTGAVLASAIRATNAGEIDAARAAGMLEGQIMRRIVLPSAFRRTLPAYANEVVLMLHATAVAGAITVMDLTAAARTVGSRSYAVLEAYFAAAVLYALVVATVVIVFRMAERRFLRHLAQPAASGDRQQTHADAG